MSYDSTVELISLALDASLMRQTAIANNIANANTRGYQTLYVNFEQQLTGFSSTSNELKKSILDSVKPYYEHISSQSPIDDQLASSIKNATHYRALIKGLNHKLAIMKLALQGNNQV